MTDILLRCAEPLTLVGGAPVARSDLDWALARAPRLAAADGGGAPILDAGRIPEAVIGDMDSLPRSIARSLPPDILHHIAEQDSTDFEKCLSRIEAPRIVGVGFLGARLDHSLAALSCLVRRPERCLLIGPDTVALHVPCAISLDLPAGTRVSLFPFVPVTGRSTGLKWPINGITLAPAGRIGTSNEATGSVDLCPDGPGLVLLLPPEARDPAWDALSNLAR